MVNLWEVETRKCWGWGGRDPHLSILDPLPPSYLGNPPTQSSGSATEFCFLCPPPPLWSSVSILICRRPCIQPPWFFCMWLSLCILRPNLYHRYYIPLQTAVQQLFHPNQTAGVKDQVCTVVQLITTTIHQIHSVFYQGESSDKGGKRYSQEPSQMLWFTRNLLYLIKTWHN